jgi:hypothetical protein
MDVDLWKRRVGLNKKMPSLGKESILLSVTIWIVETTSLIHFQ